MVDSISAMQKINRFGKYFIIAIVLLNFVGLSFADGATSIQTAMQSLCTTARNFLAIGSMLLIILAAAVYAIGQVLGAETRARASVWATAMITGAMIGIVIYLVVPNLITLMIGGTITGTDPCSFVPAT